MECEFVVMGSTGNIYNVKIGKIASCTCPDHAKGHGLCKHILFVLLKVMAIDPQSPLIYQAAWLSSELQEMFSQMERRYRQVSGAVLANASVRETYAKMESGQAAALGEDVNKVARKTVGEDDDCPICFDSLGGGATTYCRARCGANFHQVCIKHWLQQNRQKPTCPMCREPWDDGNKNIPKKEGYDNLGKLQGQSPTRDYSTYSEWFQSPYKRRRRW